MKTAPVTSTRAMLDAVRRYADSAHARPQVMEYIATLQPGTVVPSFGQLRIDRAGRIWLGAYQPPPWLGPRLPTQWTILNARGAPIARVVTPANLDIMELGDDYMLGLSRDSLGVETVRMYQLNRPR